MSSNSRNYGTKTGPGNPPLAHRFKHGNPGLRREVAISSARTSSALSDDCEKHGPAVIEKVRTDKPTDYLKIVASLLPRDIHLNVRPLDELSDDQLLARLAQLTEMAKPLLAKLETDRDEAEPEASRH